MLDWMTRNRLYDLARQGQRLTPWWGVLPLGIVMIFGSWLFAFPVAVVEIALFGLPGSDTYVARPPLLAGLFLGLNLAISFGAIILLVWLWVRFYERRSFATLGFERKNALFQYARGLIIGLLAFTTTIGLMAPFGYVSVEASDPTRVGLAALGGVILVFLPGWLIQGAAEEILTRGWMLPALGARYRPWVGILISSIFFGIMHALNPNLTALSMINLILYGAFAAMYALREESLWGICAFHSIWNWTQGNLFGMPVSGQDQDLVGNPGTIFNLMETGPDWFTGGAFGPEGGLVTTIVLVLSMLIIVFWPKQALTSAPVAIGDRR